MSDEEIRLRCLEVAARTSQLGTTAPQVVRKAHSFYTAVTGREWGRPPQDRR